MSQPLHPQAREALLARYGDRYRWQVVSVIALGLMAAVLPSGSFVVAIPSLLQTFHAAPARGQLVMTVFMVTNTIAMLPTPWLIRHVGLRNCFLSTMALLAVSSVLGALSPNFPFLIAVRAAQGAGTGTLMPMSSIVIMRLFEYREQGRAAGIMSLVVTLGPAIAPTIGGLIVDTWGWRSVSLMPLPLCLLAGAGALRYLPLRTVPERHRFDGLGMLLLSLFTLGWLGAFSNLRAAGSWLLSSVILLLAAAAAFIVHAGRKAMPLISLRVITRPHVAMSSVVSFVLGFYSYSAAYLVPLYFQVARNLSATSAGAALMPGTLALAVSAPVAGFLLDSFSPRQVMAAGSVIIALSWAVLGSFGARCSYGEFVLLVVISRVGFAGVNTPLSQAALRGLSDSALSQAAALLGYVRQLGGVLGVASLAAFVDWRSSYPGGASSAYTQSFLVVALLVAASIAAVGRLRD